MNKYYQYAKKNFENKHANDIKFFLKNHRHRTKNLSEEEKQKKVEHMKNYYLAHKKESNLDIKHSSRQIYFSA